MAIDDERIESSHEEEPEDDEEEEEDLVDQSDALKAVCQKLEKCAAFSEELQTCTQRVSSRKNTEETCLQEVTDYIQCVDHCVAKDLFSKLK